MEHHYIDLEGAPDIPGLRFRQFAGESDYPAMAVVMNAMSTHEGASAMWNPHTLGLRDQWTHSFDPPRDRVIVEVDGRMIGSARVQSEQEPDGKRLYWHSCSLLPEWRARGIEQAIIRHNESRLREIAATHPIDGPRFLRSVGIAGNNPELMQVFTEAGYRPIRYSYQMLRPDLQNIPDSPLPSGVESRPVVDADLRKIWDANCEAFRDHWGFVEPPANAYDLWKQNPDWDRSLTRVAWAGDQVVGMVLIFIPHSHNERNARKRADTESICVRRPWRKKGVATALIAQCLSALRDAGYGEAALGVDAQNPSGAVKIYERMGYKTIQRYTRFEKVFR